MKPSAHSAVHLLQRLGPWLKDESITDICCNAPEEIWIERRSGWTRERVAGLTPDWIEGCADGIGNHTGQWADKHSPLMAATIPSGERIQFVLQPAAPWPAFAIRRPSPVLMSIDDLVASGSIRLGGVGGRNNSARRAIVEELKTLLAERRVGEFLKRSVATHQNIVLSGGMGSGKTTWAKALIGAINPRERVITLEDAFELDVGLRAHIPNNLQLRYSQGGQGQANVSVMDLFLALKRLNPNRILASEMRTGDEVSMFFQLLNSGHPGGMATGHWHSAAEAFSGLGHLLLQSDAGRNMTLDAATELARRRIDIVIQCSKENDGSRCVTEIHYEPV